MLFSFTMDCDVAMEFYRRVDVQKADTEDKRTAILLEMVEEGLIKNFVATKRSKDQYIADLNKNFTVAEYEREYE